MLEPLLAGVTDVPNVTPTVVFDQQRDCAVAVPQQAVADDEPLLLRGGITEIDFLFQERPLSKLGLVPRSLPQLSYTNTWELHKT